MTQKIAYSPFYYFGREFICPTEEYFSTTDEALDYLRQNYKGDTFIALRGISSDGHDYIGMAISKGATSIVIQKDIEVNDDITVIKVSDTRRTLSRLAINYYGNPSSEMTMIGITGTKGKTTTASMIRNILLEDNKNTAQTETKE